VAAAKHELRNRVDVWASWNGATTVARWQVLSESAASKTWKLARTAPRHGFETEITVSGIDTGPTLEVRALNAAGKVLGTSKPVYMPHHY
jgi:hypothetical protein